MEGLAHAGNGTAEFAKEGERMQPKVRDLPIHHSLHAARETLVLFLKSIPEGNYFNIIGFGSSYRSLFQNTVPYDQKHLEEAVKHAQEMQADLGGTELLSPLQYIFGIKPRSGYARQIFVLTDGSVSNTNACIQLMKSNIKSSRCVFIGIFLVMLVCIHKVFHIWDWIRSFLCSCGGSCTCW